MNEELKALTPEQVNSWPVPTPKTGMDGEPLRSTVGGSHKEQSDDELLQLALERFRVCAEAESTRRVEMLEDQNFRCGNQWEKTIQIQRENQERPCLTINRIPEFLSHVVNNMRQSRPGIKVEPNGDGIDEEIAEVRQGLIRHIETNSRADTPYDTAFENMATMGLGWLRVVDDWEDPKSFNQDLFVRWVLNTFSVYSDPFCQQPDWSDMKFAFVVEDMTKAEFRARYGDDTVAASLANFQSVGDHSKYWFPGGNIRTAEYFHIEQELDTLCEMEDGTTRLYSELPKDLYSVSSSGDGQQVLLMINPDETTTAIGRARPCKIPVVHWDLISAVDVLKRRIWKGKYIPLIPVIGNQIELDGEKILVGMVRYAREPQRMYNYMYTSFVETVSLAPKAPFVAEIDQVPDGLVEEWQESNKRPTALLRYKAKVAEGENLVPPPSRQQANPPIQAFVEGLQMCDQNLKSVFRIFDASLGQRGPQESGLAINARKIESDTGTYDWGDNFIRALRYLGIVLNDLLEYYYNTPGRIIQIVGEDETSRPIKLNQQFREEGQDKIYDLSKGAKGAVTITTGPSYQTRRQETAAQMLEASKANPALWQIAGDLIVKSLDWPGKDALAARLEKGLPPQFKDPDQDADMPPEAMAKIQQMQGLVQQLTEALHQATDKTELERMKQEYETQRTLLVQQTNIAINEMKVGSQEAQFLNEKVFNEMESMKQLLLQHLGGGPGGPAPASPTPAPAAPLAQAA